MTLFRKFARYSAPQNNIKTNQVVIGCIYGSKTYNENINYQINTNKHIYDDLIHTFFQKVSQIYSNFIAKQASS